MTIDANGDSNGKLVVPGATSLSIATDLTVVLQDTPDSAQPHEIGGVLALSASSSVLRVEEEMTFGPDVSSNYGSVVGQDNAATLEIVKHSSENNTTKLTNQITIEGRMLITAAGSGEGSATFENAMVANDPFSGFVWSNDSGVLEFANGLLVTDSSNSFSYRPAWEASAQPGSILRFATDAAIENLIGHFYIDDCAIVEIVDVHVKTAGDLFQFAGTLDTYGPGAPCFTYLKGNPFETQVCGDITVGQECME